jgi:hypothetical protein
LGGGRGGPSSVSYPSSNPDPRIHGPDCIESLVRQLAGKTLKIELPDSFAKAVAEITHPMVVSR